MAIEHLVPMATAAWRFIRNDGDTEAVRRNAMDRFTNQTSIAAPNLRAQLSRAGIAPAVPNYNRALGELQGSYDARAEATARLRNEISGMFNLGESPAARALYDNQAADIGRRLTASTTAVNDGFAGAANQIDARRANIDPAAAAAAARALFAQGADNIGAINAVSDQGLSNAGGADTVGIGPITGDAVATQRALAASGAVAGNAAAANAQVTDEDLAWLAATTTQAGAARAGELQSYAAAAQNEAYRRFAEQEMARQQHEADQMRSAELRLAEQQAFQASDFQRERADLLMRSEDGRVDAENRWVDQFAAAELDSAQAGFESQVGWNNVLGSLDLIAATGNDGKGPKKSDFTAAFAEARASDPVGFVQQLQARGLPTSADAYWEMLQQGGAR